MREEAKREEQERRAEPRGNMQEKEAAMVKPHRRRSGSKLEKHREHTKQSMQPILGSQPVDDSGAD